MNRYSQTTQQPEAPPPATYSDRQFLHTYIAGALLPLVQATITAVMVTLVAGVMLYAFNAIDIVKPSLVFGLLAWVGTWLYLQRRWLVLTQLERWFGDLNNDGYIGEPPPQKVTITVNRVKENQHVEQMNYTFPVSDQQVARFFTTVKTSTRGGKGISRRQWTPKNVNGFSEGEWDEFYRELVVRRLVIVRGNECVLTEEGEEIAEGWYSRTQAEPPSPTAEDA